MQDKEPYNEQKKNTTNPPLCYTLHFSCMCMTNIAKPTHIALPIACSTFSVQQIESHFCYKLTKPSLPHQET